ncbi:PIN domain-containing protein [Streptomyces sp. NPDC052101]|uniref:PIN domain-containing protein n=1 Tax=Streptomyces sp. NPDC052101 TaxID=3155763 RepID=UPI003412CD48
MDTSILRTFSPDSSTADLVQAIQQLGTESVAVPWMVLEELAAQQAIKYREKYEAAARAVEALQHATPWLMDVSLGECELDGVRAYWRSTWREVIETIPTSEEALREAAFREANALPPCKTSKGEKTGSRDAAIWLSAVEYARKYAQKTVYFVSANTRDFSQGAPYPFPMCDDLAGIEDRFVHLTAMSDVLTRFTEPVETNDTLVLQILRSPAVLEEIVTTAQDFVPNAMQGYLDCTASTGLADGTVLVSGYAWTATKATLGTVERVETYRIADKEWCTAVVQWHLGGVVLAEAFPTGIWAGCSWTTSVMFAPDSDDPGLVLLRDERPQPLGDEDFKALGLPLSDPPPTTPVEHAVADLVHAASEALFIPNLHPLRGQRTYEGALARKASRVVQGETFAG